MRIVRGAPGSGKTALVFREFKAAVERGEDPRIVAPTATLVRHFQHELARDKVVCRPRSVISLARLAVELAGDVKAASPVLIRALISESLQELELPAFAEAARTGGMAAIVEETISLFENAGCGPERLERTRGLSARGKAFARVWRAVDQRLREAGYVSRLDLFRAATANAREMNLWFDGFLHFSPLEVGFIEALGDKGNVTVTAPESGDGSLFDERLSGQPRRPPMTAVGAESVEREADEIARRIARLHSQGTAFREIGVALRDPGVYAPLLRGVFERYGIPARFYFAQPLHAHPAATFRGGLLDGAISGWDHRDVLSALRADPRWGHTAAFDRFDFAVREKLPSMGADELLSVAQEPYAKRIAECIAIRNWPHETLHATEWARRLEQLAGKLYMPGRIDEPAAFTDVETLRSQSAGLHAWIETVAEVASLWPEDHGPIPLAEYWTAARQAVRDASYRISDERRDVVHVMSSYEARQWDVATLFICGATNSDYPQRRAQNLLFPDSEIDALRKAGIPLRRSSDLEEEEDELWRELRCRARSELVVTVPKRDGGGRSVEASRYLSEADASDGAVVAMPAGGEPNRRGSRGRISSGELLAAIAAAHPQVGVTSMEDLAQCRFRFFASKTLRLRTPPERPEQRLQPKISGLIMHEALEEWLKVNRSSDFVSLYEAAFEKMRIERNLPAGFRLEVERVFLRGVAEKVSTTELWSAESTEAEVPFELPLTPTLKVGGRIDRIDRMNATDCVIIDYKGGRTKRVEGFLRNPAKLQGPLYALAAREIFGLNTIAMMYIAVRDDKRIGWGSIPGVELELVPMPENWIDDARALAIQRVSELMAGIIEASPTEDSECRFCDFRAACHVKEDQEEVIRISAATSGESPGV